MYRGKFADAGNGKRWIAAGALAALLLGGSGGTLAFLTATEAPVRNDFSYGTVTTSINESFDGSVKEAVSVSNTGNTDALIRARVVFSWQDSRGNVYPKEPEAGDYEILYGDGWTLQDEYWYCNTPVIPGERTPELIRYCRAEHVLEIAGTVFYLKADILAEGIQAAGTVNSGAENPGLSAVLYAWEHAPQGMDGGAAP